MKMSHTASFTTSGLKFCSDCGHIENDRTNITETKQLVISLPSSRAENFEFMLASSHSLSPFHLDQDPVCELALPTSRLGLSISVKPFKKTPHRLAHRPPNLEDSSLKLLSQVICPRQPTAGNDGSQPSLFLHLVPGTSVFSLTSLTKLIPQGHWNQVSQTGWLQVTAVYGISCEAQRLKWGLWNIQCLFSADTSLHRFVLFCKYMGMDVQLLVHMYTRTYVSMRMEVWRQPWVSFLRHHPLSIGERDFD